MNVRYAQKQESSSEDSLIGLLKISKTAYAHTARHMREFTGKKPMRLDRRNKVQIPFALRSQMTFRLLRDSSQ